jgi:hypothetical protein
MSAPTTPGPAPSRSRLRWLGVGLLVLVLAEILVGNQLAVVGSPYPVGYLALHVILALLLVGLAVHAVRRALREGRGAAQASAALALVSVVGAGISGAVFLYAGQNNGALYGMEGLGGLAFLAAINLLVFGGARPAPAPMTPPGTA